MLDTVENELVINVGSLAQTLPNAKELEAVVPRLRVAEDGKLYWDFVAVGFFESKDRLAVKKMKMIFRGCTGAKTTSADWREGSGGNLGSCFDQAVSTPSCACLSNS